MLELVDSFVGGPVSDVHILTLQDEILLVRPSNCLLELHIHRIVTIGLCICGLDNIARCGIIGVQVRASILGRLSCPA